MWKLTLHTVEMGESTAEEHLEDDSEHLEAQQPDQVAGQFTVQIVAGPCIPLEVHHCLHCL